MWPCLVLGCTKEGWHGDDRLSSYLFSLSEVRGHAEPLSVAEFVPLSYVASSAAGNYVPFSVAKVIVLPVDIVAIPVALCIVTRPEQWTPTIMALRLASQGQEFLVREITKSATSTINQTKSVINRFVWPNAFGRSAIRTPATTSTTSMSQMVRCKCTFPATNTTAKPHAVVPLFIWNTRYNDPFMKLLAKQIFPEAWPTPIFSCLHSLVEWIR